jgi:hypothetical protein
MINLSAHDGVVVVDTAVDDISVSWPLILEKGHHA